MLGQRKHHEDQKCSALRQLSRSLALWLPAQGIGVVQHLIHYPERTLRLHTKATLLPQCNDPVQMKKYTNYFYMALCATIVLFGLFLLQIRSDDHMYFSETRMLLALISSIALAASTFILLWMLVGQTKTLTRITTCVLVVFSLAFTEESDEEPDTRQIAAQRYGSFPSAMLAKNIAPDATRLATHTTPELPNADL